MTKKMTNVEAFDSISNMLDAAPESLSDQQLVALLLGLLANYTGAFPHALAVIFELTLRLHDFHGRFTSENCECPTCVAERKSNAH